MMAAPLYLCLYSGVLSQLRFITACDTFSMLHRGGLAVGVQDNEA